MADIEVATRLRKIIEDMYNITPHAFSQKYGDKGGVKTSQVLRGRNGLSSKLLDDILEAYPEINKAWLLTGDGDMAKAIEQNVEKNTSDNVTMSREVFDMINKMTETMHSQQRTIEKMQDQRSGNVQPAEDVGCAGVG